MGLSPGILDEKGDTMKFHSVHIEREEGNAICGTLVYTLGKSRGTLLWSIELTPRREIRVDVFPCQQEDAARINMAERLIVDHLLDTLLAQRSMVARSAC